MLKRLLVFVALGAIGGLSARSAGALPTQDEPSRGPWVPSWYVAYGGYRQVADLAVVGPSEAWGVATAATGTGADALVETAFVHWEGETARAAFVVEGLVLSAIDMVGPEFGLAVGAEGAVYRYDGRRWREQECPVRLDLTDVELRSESDGWVVGDRSTIMRWDGTGLEVVLTSDDLPRLNAVATASSGEAWAITADGRILRYDGQGTWDYEPSPQVRQLTDIAFASPDWGLAVGLAVLERRGGAWRQVETSARWTVSVAWDEETAYMVADDRLRRYTAAGWADLEYATAPVDLGSLNYRRVLPGSGGVWALVQDGTAAWIADGVAELVWPRVRTMAALDMVSPEYGWAGGEAMTHGLVGPVGPAWTHSVSMPFGSAVLDVDLVSEDDGWAVAKELAAGAFEYGLWRWDGTDWSKWPTDKTWRLEGVSMVAADDGWVSGSNVVARWDGEDWIALTGAPAEAMTGVLSMLRGGEEAEGWFGSLGAIYHLLDDSWTRQELPGTAMPVTRICMASSREGWAIAGSEAFAYDGQEWSRLDLPPGVEEGVSDVHAPASGDVWFLTNRDQLLRRYRGDWELHSLEYLGRNRKPVRIRAVPSGLAEGADRESQTDVWMAGEGPTISRYRIVTPMTQLFLPACATGGQEGSL